MHTRSIADLAGALRRHELTAAALTEHYLERIERLDPGAHAYLLPCPAQARAAARAVDTLIEAGVDPGPLAGIPFAVKDLFDVRGLATTAGTHLLADNVADDDSAAVTRLRRAGMVLLGKTHTVQFAYSGIGINHDQGTPRNPWASEHHVAGGSSSGSAVAVAAGLAPAALGSDTGGSVRIPAALCGITGLKTTVGRVSRAGVYPLSPTLDTVGPLTRSVVDAAQLLQALHGPDLADPTTFRHPPQDFLSTLDDGVAVTRIVLEDGVLFEDVDPELAAAVRDTGEVFAGLGAHVERRDIPEARAARDLNPRGLIIAAEGYDVNRRLLEGHIDELDPVVARRLLHGREALAHEYLAALRDRHRLQARIQERLRDVDAILCPTTLLPARPVATVDADRESYRKHNMAYLRNTAIGNLLNLCALSVPCGFTAEGLPIGLMIYAKPFDEATLLRVGHAYQQASDWHRRTPSIP